MLLKQVIVNIKFGKEKIIYRLNWIDFISGDLDIVEVLIENGADTKCRNERGNTPLHYASSAKVAKILLENGADFNATNIFGNTALHEAAIRGISF